MKLKGLYNAESKLFFLHGRIFLISGV